MILNSDNLKHRCPFKNSTGGVTVLIVMLLMFSACTKNFKEINTNPAGLTDEQANGDYTLVASFLQQAQRTLIADNPAAYQQIGNFNGDSFSGFMMPPSPFRSNAYNTTYNLIEPYCASSFVNRYQTVMNPAYKVVEMARTIPDYKDLDALARILRVTAMNRVTDKFGPIIFSRYNQADDDGTVHYDTQEDAYTFLFSDLDTAIKTLVSLKEAPVSPQMQKADLAYTSDNYRNWLRYANSLRLRMALRISKVAPEKAKAQGEAALDPASGGLLTENGQNCFIKLLTTHPQTTISNDWSDIRMGASMESILSGFEDPRVSAYFLPAKDAAVAGQFKGIRCGINIDAKSRYEGYSALVPLPPKMQMMVAAESWFLKAEAALRGWANAGDAATDYNTGIDRSFEQYGLSDKVTAYKNNAINTPAPYTDPKAMTPGQNDVDAGSPYLSTITVKWEEGVSNDRKLERIITQKWIALFPDGEEAWAEYRRTGYPVLFPIVLNNSGGIIPTIPGIRRLPIPQREYNTNTNGANEAATMLNGPDNGATRLWWDLADKSF
ncbi:SusD/RagB family nutrient-binding outer membrane lipoprotein [Niabella aurantiaca]|uniref:SusD/RagB family nutrient-binding outer membrane lipoprotein n=1 Tax=Niabella aurantiaca TaxID=379900 RepID=UPI00035DFDCC|nr:SusD/RagB family nutrient-binding outer membrane lipoprotein [Niabella aurantiaca]